jgi:hypothetical protein
MKNEVYTDLEPSYGEHHVGPGSALYHFIFHFNPYTNLWSAVHRDDYLHYWSDGNHPRVIRSKSIDTLQEIILKTGGEVSKIEKLISEQ